jgi:uncharacterized protein (TIGR00251 family)
VAPGAAADRFLGYLGEDLKISLTAPPVDGKANAALLSFLARSLGLKKGAVSLVAGASSRRKVAKIDGLRPEELHERLRALMEG